ETPPAAPGVYGDRERRVLNKHLGRRAFADDLDASPFDVLQHVHALAAARHKVILSYPQSDGDRETARAAFVGEGLRIAPLLPMAEVPRSPVPVAVDAGADADVLARVALETWADPAGRLPPAPPAPVPAVPPALAPRLLRIEALAAIERARWQYFAGAEPANAWVGMVPPQAYGSADAPLTARQLELLAHCPVPFYAGRGLGVDPADDIDDAAPPHTLGALAHRALELFYRRRAEARALPVRGSDEDRAALAAACAVAFAREGTRGHPALWEVTREKL